MNRNSTISNSVENSSSSTGLDPLQIRPLALSLRAVCLALLTSGTIASSGLGASLNKPAPVSFSQDPLVKVDGAVLSGAITNSAGRVLKLQYMLDKRSLPVEYRVADQAMLKCGFSLSGDVTRNWSELNHQQQSLVTSLVGRPAMDTSVVSPAAHFRLHFDTIGAEAVPFEDLDLNGTPDFVDRAGAYLDSAWNLYHTKLGYLTPPDDGTTGGDAKYDIYFAAIGGYGITFFDQTGPAPWDDFTSFILVHHDFAGFLPNQDPEGTQVGALKVTCAHEYFHAVQLAYDGFDDLWMYESSSTWNEVELFPEVKDNYQYLPFFYNDPDTFLTTNGGFYPYGAFVWPTYLAENFTDTLMRKIWEASRFSNGIDAIDGALSGWGLSTQDIFGDFGVWNFYTADRAQAGYFPNGAEYLGAIIDRGLPVIPFSNEHPLKAPDGLGSTYMSLTSAGAPPGLLLLEFTGDVTVVWDMSVILKSSSGEYETRSAQMDFNKTSGTFALYDFTNWDSLFVSAQVVSRWNNDNDFSLSSSVLPYGDANGSSKINVADITFLIAYIFNLGQAPPFDVLLGDANCSGRVNISDITFLIQHIFAGGPAPCAQ